MLSQFNQLWKPIASYFYITLYCMYFLPYIPSTMYTIYRVYLPTCTLSTVRTPKCVYIYPPPCVPFIVYTCTLHHMYSLAYVFSTIFVSSIVCILHHIPIKAWVIVTFTYSSQSRIFKTFTIWYIIFLIPNIIFPFLYSTTYLLFTFTHYSLLLHYYIYILNQFPIFIPFKQPLFHL